MFLKRKDFFDGPGTGKEGAAPERAASSKDKPPVAEREAGATPHPETTARTRAPLKPAAGPRPQPQAAERSDANGPLPRRGAAAVRVTDRRLEAQLDYLEQLARASKRDDLAGEVRLVRAYLGRERFTVAVVGEFSRGKSSLINALVGRDVIPTGATPTTKVPIHVQGGRQACIVAPTPSGRRVYPLDDDGWSDLEREEAPQELAVRVPCALLAEGDLELVDTPGVNSQIVNDFTFADRALVSCDCAILAVSAVAPLSELERHLLEEHLVAREVPRVMVVITMLDLVDPGEREALVEYIGSGIRSISSSCPIYLSEEGLLEGWERQSGPRAISRQLLSWVEQSGHRALKLARARTEASVIAQSLRELFGLRLAALDDDRAKREEATRRAERETLSTARIDWGELEVEFLNRCNQNFERIRKLSVERQRDLLERFSIELSHSPNPKDWYQLDYPYRMKSELVSFGNTLESTLQKSYGKDVTWLNRELESRYGIKVPPEATRIADRELFRQSLGQSDVRLRDMRATRIASRMGAGALTVGAYAIGSALSLGPIGIAMSTGLGIVSEIVLNGTVSRQRRALERTLSSDVPEIYGRCIKTVEDGVRDLYNKTAEELRGTYDSWVRARSAAVSGPGAGADPEGQRTKIAKIVSNLDAIIERRPITKS